MKNIIITGTLCLFIACSSNNTESPEQNSPQKLSALSYQTDTIKKRYGSCETDTSIYCTQVNFTFPVFEGSAKTTELNKALEQELLKVYLKDSTSNSLSTHANDFIADYKKIKERFDQAFGWQSSLNSQVIHTDSNLLVLETIVELYTGGAHGTYEVYYLNLDTAKGKALRLADVFTTGYESSLNTIVKNAIYNSNDHVSVTDVYYNSNFGLLEGGVKFYFNPHEIAPYASGPAEVLIPFSQLKDIMKNHYK